MKVAQETKEIPKNYGSFFIKACHIRPIFSYYYLIMYVHNVYVYDSEYINVLCSSPELC